jgi:predicted dehydrogenase
MSYRTFSRREVIKKGTAAAAVFTIVPRHVLGGASQIAPSDEITRGLIGTGSMGNATFVDDLRWGSRLVATCDADHDRMLDNLTKYPDWRDMIADPGIDFVCVATPPHWHTLPIIAAAKAGKDVFCLKPAYRTIYEGIKAVETCRRYGTIAGFGITGGRADGQGGPGIMNFGAEADGIRIRDLWKVVESGVLGTPLTVNAGNGIAGHDFKLDMWTGLIDQTPQSVPSNLDYDMWLGPAPYKPYFYHRTHGSFRGYWDYDGGGLGDMGFHYLDPLQFALHKDNDSPVEAIAEGPPQHPDAAMPWIKVTMKYRDGTTIVLHGNGSSGDVLLRGPNGTNRDIPGGLQAIQDAYPELPPQEKDWNKCIIERKKYVIDEEIAQRTCNLINIALIAIRLPGRKLNFDPDKQEFIDDPQANALAKQPMRAPWNIEDGEI